MAKLDQRYHGTQQGEVGPLVRRLESYGPLKGLVIGAFQEGSKDVHSLLEILADSQLKSIGLARGREGSSQEKSIVLAGLRRQLSLVSAKAYSACIMDRVSRLGEKHRQAAKRRAWAKRAEEKMAEERRAHWNAFIRGIGLSRGHFIE